MPPEDEQNTTTAQPFLKWAGGKRWFVKRYSSVFPTRFRRYFEPFLGSGAVFFALNPKAAILSDVNADLINLYKVVREQWQSLLERLTVHQRNHSRDYYYAIRDKARAEDLVSMAADFLYLNRTCWNGLYRVNLRGSFNVPIGTKLNVILPNDNFQANSGALRCATLVACDFESTIDAAGDGDLVFVDPPYTVRHNNNCFVKYNEKLFAWSDQVRLRDALSRACNRGAKIIATNAAHDSIKELYGNDFIIEEVWRKSVIAGKSLYRKECAELLIRGNT